MIDGPKVVQVNFIKIYWTLYWIGRLKEFKTGQMRVHNLLNIAPNKILNNKHHQTHPLTPSIVVYINKCRRKKQLIFFSLSNYIYVPFVDGYAFSQEEGGSVSQTDVIRAYDTNLPKPDGKWGCPSRVYENFTVVCWNRWQQRFGDEHKRMGEGKGFRSTFGCWSVCACMCLWKCGGYSLRKNVTKKTNKNQILSSSILYELLYAFHIFNYVSWC